MSSRRPVLLQGGSLSCELVEHERVTSAHRRIGDGTSGSAAKWTGFAAAKDTDESFGSKQTAMLRLKRNISVHSSKARSS